MSRCCFRHPPGWDPYALHGDCGPDHETRCRSVLVSYPLLGHAELMDFLHGIFGKHTEGGVEFVAYDGHACINLGTSPFDEVTIRSRFDEAKQQHLTERRRNADNSGQAAPAPVPGG